MTAHLRLRDLFGGRVPGEKRDAGTLRRIALGGQEVEYWLHRGRRRSIGMGVSGGDSRFALRAG